METKSDNGLGIPAPQSQSKINIVEILAKDVFLSELTNEHIAKCVTSAFRSISIKDINDIIMTIKDKIDYYCEIELCLCQTQRDEFVQLFRIYDVLLSLLLGKSIRVLEPEGQES